MLKRELFSDGPYTEMQNSLVLALSLSIPI